MANSLELTDWLHSGDALVAVERAIDLGRSDADGFAASVVDIEQMLKSHPDLKGPRYGMREKVLQWRGDAGGRPGVWVTESDAARAVRRFFSFTATTRGDSQWALATDADIESSQDVGVPDRLFTPVETRSVGIDVGQTGWGGYEKSEYGRWRVRERVEVSDNMSTAGALLLVVVALEFGRRRWGRATAA